MISKPLTAGLLVAGCLAAAAGGAYVAVRSNRADVSPVTQAVPVPAATVPQAAQPVSESEGVIAPAPQAEVQQAEAAPVTAPDRPSAEPAVRPRAADGQRRADAPRNTRPPSAAAARAASMPAPPPSAPVVPGDRPAAGEQSAASPAAPGESATAEPARALEPAVPVRHYEELVVPASSVVSLQLQSTISSERARVEDRVDARVTRDVMADNGVAIPAGSRVFGTVVGVERGGKVKERARLDVRFHTLVLADGTEVPMRTETVSRLGESPTGESARKIGGAAVGGAILGAIIGGGKGATIGAATGAAGGTAAVMAGDRNAATLAAGTILSVRLANPVTIEVAK